VRVFGSVPTAELDTILTSMLHKGITSVAISIHQAPVPKIEKVSGAYGKVRLGKEFVVEVEVDGDNYSNVKNETGVSTFPKIKL